MQGKLALYRSFYFILFYKYLFRNLVKQGKLSKAVSKLRTEVKAQHKTISSLQSELDEYRGPRVDNPWQIGVPYGYRATKISSSTRK